MELFEFFKENRQNQIFIFSILSFEGLNAREWYGIKSKKRGCLFILRQPLIGFIYNQNLKIAPILILPTLAILFNPKPSLEL